MAALSRRQFAAAPSPATPRWRWDAERSIRGRSNGVRALLRALPTIQCIPSPAAPSWPNGKSAYASVGDGPRQALSIGFSALDRCFLPRLRCPRGGQSLRRARASAKGPACERKSIAESPAQYRRGDESFAHSWRQSRLADSCRARRWESAPTRSLPAAGNAFAARSFRNSNPHTPGGLLRPLALLSQILL